MAAPRSSARTFPVITADTCLHPGNMTLKKGMHECESLPYATASTSGGIRGGRHVPHKVFIIYWAQGCPASPTMGEVGCKED